MAQPETTFRLSVERHLPPPPHLHREKMANPYRGGTADSWYSSLMSDLWVEWKYIDHLPKSKTIEPKLSAKQSAWLSGRLAEGRVVAVILGTCDGGVIYTQGDWTVAYPIDVLAARLLPRKALARWIEGVVCAGQDVSWRPQP
jgi:hypothetical protein